MNTTNKRIRNFRPYNVASHKVWNLSQEERNNVLKLDWNEASIEPTPLVKERIMKLLDNNEFFHLYPSTNNPAIYKLLSEYVGLPEENIQYFGSSDSAHEYVAKMYISEGDSVLILWPSYDNFRLTAEVCGAKVYYSEFEQEFSFNERKFEDDIDTIKPSLVYICNPNNPTGNLHSVEYIERLLSKYEDVVFLVDEAYYEFSQCTVCNLVNQYENLLVTRTMSKAFALANYRFGYLIASKDNINYISSVRNPKNITTFAQEAAIAALSDIDYMKRYVEQVQSAKKYFKDALCDLEEVFKLYDSHGNFVLIKLNDYATKLSFINYMENNNVFIRNLSQSEGLKTCIRISVGTVEQMTRVVELMKKFVSTL